MNAKSKVEENVKLSKISKDWECEKKKEASSLERRGLEKRSE
jgi:hypothetical protein